MEYLLVGGGLQNALIALALLARRPDVRLTLIEKEARLGGNHTWCFHAGDAPAAAQRWLDELVVRRWPCHDVWFSGHRRRLQQAYSAITSERLHQVLSERLRGSPHARILTATVRQVARDQVTLDDGSTLRAELVIDARGPDRAARFPAAGYQKFLGLELELCGGEMPDAPLLMDATVEQLDGFRFMYVLPWDDRRVLVEDTYYSSDPLLDAGTLEERIFAYARGRGWQVARVLRSEAGVLPLPTRSARTAAAPQVLSAGYAGGLFHPTTGYSLPVALRFALRVASLPASALGGEGHARWLSTHERQFRFGVRLNRLLFEAFAPERRHRVLERFYRLPADTIRRFYALETTGFDRARILCGRPPAGFSLPRLLAAGRSP